MVRVLLVAVHGHALAVPAELTVGRWRDGTGRVTADGRALLERKQLLGTEGLVVDLRGCLDEVLQVGAGKEVAEVYEFAVGLVLDCQGLAVHLKYSDRGGHTVDDAPLVLAAADVPAVDDNGAL
jgi:hypothetical protein